MATNQMVPVDQVWEILGPGGQYEKKRVELRREYGSVVMAAKAITVIDSQEAVEAAANVGRLLKVASKETEDFFKEIKKKVDAVKAPILAAEKEDGGPYAQEGARIAALHVAYNQKVRREKEEADRIAREKAEAEAREDALIRAVELESMGEKDAAEQVLIEPIAPIHVSTPAAPKVAGSVAKFIYSASVVNLMALVKAVAAGTVPLSALQANEQFLNAQARSFKDAFSYPGVHLDKREDLHYRR